MAREIPSARPVHRRTARAWRKLGLIQGFQGIPGGAEGNRTPDLIIANDALYQLSYGPKEGAE